MTRQLRSTADRVNDRHEWLLRIAEVVATRSSCARRAVGAVIVDEVGYILSTGYNGPARGQLNCTETHCAGAEAAPGTQLDACIAIHAEVNAIAQARSIKEARALYCTETHCSGAEAEPGTQLDACIAIHAEVNAIAQARSIKEARALYCTVSPCISCAKILSNLPNLKLVFFRSLYATPQAIAHLQAVGIRAILVRGQRDYEEVRVEAGEIVQRPLPADKID